MIKNSFKKLEYYIILDNLSTYASTYLGKKLCLETIPSFSYTEVKQLQERINEAYSFIIKYDTPPLSEIPDIFSILKKLDIKYTLTIKEILDINYILILSENLRKYFFINDNIVSSEFSYLNTLFSNIYTNTSLSKEISSTFIDENTVNDSASNKLFELRKKARKLENDVKDKLNCILHSSSYKKYIQEPVITIRNDRYVIPVKSEFRASIKGFIHDTSSSGSTIFIEPISTFEINNQINNIKFEEKIEIEKILIEFSNKLSMLTLQIENTVNTIGNIDYIFAKAKYSKKFNGIPPILNDKKEIYLLDARHPLIDKNKIVPINIELGNNFKTLIITGPNTGGKTVTLKTVGLILLMAYSGLYIPAKENSSIPVFDMIYADIGDEQSIQESLSTFSAHITKIVYIVKKATKNSLVLLDELGSGTDPEQGSALAISILDHFNKKLSLTIATTHYSELKEYALLTDGFENASVSFDMESLKPTYNLIIGVPGKSNAFEISKKLGLDSKIIEKAKSFINENTFNMEELINNIYNDKIIIEHEKKEIQKNSNQIDLLKKSLEHKKDEIEAKKEKILNDAKNQARIILQEAKEKSSLAIKEINNIKNFPNESQIKDLNNIRNDLNKSIKNIINYGSHNSSEINTQSYELYPNMKVYITNLNQNGTILSVSKRTNESHVQIGNSKLMVQNEYIIPKENQKEDINRSIKVNYSAKRSIKHATTEINLLGKNVEEAIFLVDKFLDDASIEHMQSVRIVHGKGTGALKKGIHKFLKTHPHVKSYRLGTFGEGEMGVTIVEIK